MTKKLFQHDSELQLWCLLAAVVASRCCISLVLSYMRVCFHLGHLQDSDDRCWLSGVFSGEELHASGTHIGGVGPSKEHSYYQSFSEGWW